MTHRLMKMTGAGDEELGTWSPTDQTSLDEVMALFGQEVKNGATPFRMDPDGENHEQIKGFDPNAEEILLVPMVAGG